MGYVTTSDGQSYVQLQTTVTTSQLFTVPGSYTDFGYGGDIFFFCGGDVYTPSFVSDPLRCIDILGCSASGENSIAKEIDYRTIKPVNEYWDPAEDWRRYGGLFGIANRLSGPDTPLAHLREKGVRHPSYVGGIEDITSFDRYETLNGFNQSWGNAISFPLYSPTGLTANKFFLKSPGFASNGFLQFEEGTPSEYHLGFSFNGNAWDVAMLLNEHLNSPGATAYYDSGYWRFTIRDYTGRFQRSYNRWDLWSNYEYEMRFGSGPYVTVKFRTDVHHYAGYVPSYGGNNPNDSNRIPEETFFASSSSSGELLSVDFPPDIVPYVNVLHNNPPTIQWGESYGYATTQLHTRPYQAEGYLDDKFTTYRCFDGSDPSRRHSLMADNVVKILPHLRPSSFYSASSALQAHIEVIKANHLENLSQLSGILKLLPDLAPLSRVAAKAVKRDLSAVVDMIDILTDAVLAFRFAQAPTAKDAAEILRTDIEEEISNLLASSTVTSYGEFTWEFPDEFNFTSDFDGSLVLETRSKVRIRLDMSTLLVNYLTANSVGLLPTLSRIWETLPFTFVVDWFTNMDDRLNAVDNQLLWMAIRTDWCLHSYTVTYYPSPEELLAYGLKSSLEDPFGVRMYIREFTRCTPLLRESKFDFLSPTNGPDPVTVGSLVWQAI